VSGCAKGGEVGEYGRVIATETRPVDPGDPYVDPPRNWKRVGLIAAAWAALWVVVGALGWVVMQVPALNPEDPRVGTNDSARETVQAFVQEVFSRPTDEDIDSAQLFLCDQPGEVAAQARQVRNDWRQLQTTTGKVLALPAPLQISGEPPTLTVGVPFVDTDALPETWVFTVVDQGGWKVCGLTLA